SRATGRWSWCRCFTRIMFGTGWRRTLLPGTLRSRRLPGFIRSIYCGASSASVRTRSAVFKSRSTCTTPHTATWRWRRLSKKSSGDWACCRVNRLPKFSVIIPTFNRGDLLERTLASVRAQTFADFDLIVVDDGSTDRTAESLRAQAKSLRVFSQSNRGPGAARNLGAANAGGTYLAFLDSDDLWFPWTLATFAAAIDKYGQPSVLSGSLVRFHNERELAAVTEEPVLADAYSDYI